MLRKLLLVVLILGVVGFGVCSLCSGFIGFGMLTETRASSRELAWLGFAIAGLAGFLAWLCWFGCKLLWKRAKPADPPDASPP